VSLCQLLTLNCDDDDDLLSRGHVFASWLFHCHITGQVVETHMPLLPGNTVWCQPFGDRKLLAMHDRLRLSGMREFLRDSTLPRRSVAHFSLVNIRTVNIVPHVATWLLCFRQKYFMIGEENEKKEIDEETALDHDPRLTELGRLMTCVTFDCRIHFAVCLNSHCNQ